jgi:hypothetical protein
MERVKPNKWDVQSLQENKEIKISEKNSRENKIIQRRRKRGGEPEEDTKSNKGSSRRKSE